MIIINRTNLNTLKQHLKIFILVFLLYISFYFIFNIYNLSTFLLELLIGAFEIILGFTTCVILIRFILFEISYNIKKRSIGLFLMILIFFLLPISIFMIIITFTLKQNLISNFSKSLYIGYFHIVYIIEIPFAIIGSLDGYNSAIEDGKYDDIIIKNIKNDENKNEI